MSMAATDTASTRNPKALSGGDRPPGVFTDRVFRWLVLAAGLTVLVVLALIIVSTVNEAWPWLREEGFGAIFGTEWNPVNNQFGALPLIVGTLTVALIALVIAVPISVGIALFVTEIAPRRVQRPVVYTIDLLAAIPSVVFGLWAFHEFTRPLADVYSSVSDALSGVPLLGSITADPNPTGQAIMTGGIVVGIMITPIVTSIIREVFATCPSAQKEAALALGATRWEMIRGAVFPHARSGMAAAIVIGFGRAVGETIAVAIIIGASPQLTEHIFGPGETMASIIAHQFGEASGTHRAALIGLGVVLLGLTVILGMAARAVLARGERRIGATT